MSKVTKNQIWIEPAPTLTNAVSQVLHPNAFKYYDKDGFELCNAEREYYTANSVRMNDCLNHMCCQQDWLSIEAENVFVDHALLLHRYEYTEDARAQLFEWQKTIPQASWLLQTRAKWGFDLAVDAMTDSGIMYEVVHIEYDDVWYETFYEKFQLTVEMIQRTDWEEAARQIWIRHDEWKYLKGFYQNHWKSKYLFGWNKAEYTEKTA